MDAARSRILTSPGVLLFVTSSPAMPSNGLLLGLGADVVPL